MCHVIHTHQSGRMFSTVPSQLLQEAHHSFPPTTIPGKRELQKWEMESVSLYMLSNEAALGQQEEEPSDEQKVAYPQVQITNSESVNWGVGTCTIDARPCKPRFLFYLSVIFALYSPKHTFPANASLYSSPESCSHKANRTRTWTCVYDHVCFRNILFVCSTHGHRDSPKVIWVMLKGLSNTHWNS